jgi:hypothetical protein
MAPLSASQNVEVGLALNKDAPLYRIKRSVGSIQSRPLLGGLYHEYIRI